MEIITSIPLIIENKFDISWVEMCAFRETFFNI